jgi:hypothetical protein
VLDALRQLTVLSGVTKESGRETPDRELINIEETEKSPFRTPLTGSLNIQTSPSAYSCSTDTASETGSAFNSPNQISHQLNTIQQHQPSSADLANSTYVKDFSRLVVVKMGGISTEVSGDSMYLSILASYLIFLHLSNSYEYFRYRQISRIRELTSSSY